MAALRPTVAYGNTDDGSGAGVNGSSDGRSIAYPDPNPDPDPPDPHVFGPPGSGSFYHHATIVRKTSIPSIL